MYEYVCMNIDVMNMYEYVRMNFDVRVPSLIAGSLPSNHDLAQISTSTFVDCGCFYFWSLLRQKN